MLIHGCGTVAALLLATAAFAGWLPARRVTRIDPMRALRQEQSGLRGVGFACDVTSENGVGIPAQVRIRLYIDWLLPSARCGESAAALTGVPRATYIDRR